MVDSGWWICLQIIRLLSLHLLALISSMTIILCVSTLVSTKRMVLPLQLCLIPSHHLGTSTEVKPFESTDVIGRMNARTRTKEPPLTSIPRLTYEPHSANNPLLRGETHHRIHSYIPPNLSVPFSDSEPLSGNLNAGRFGAFANGDSQSQITPTTFTNTLSHSLGNDHSRGGYDYSPLATASPLSQRPKFS